MKNSTYGFLAIVAVIFTIAACTKDGKLNAPVGHIAATYTNLQINEPDLMALVGADSTKTVDWSITPAGSDILTSQNIAARVEFSKAGVYTVHASQTGFASASITIKVSDTVYSPNKPFSAGEQITLVPKYVKSATSDSSYLAFTATTKNSYCANSSMDFGAFYDFASTFSYYMQFEFVVTDGNCEGSAHLTGYFDYSPYQASLTNGIYPLYISFNGQPNVEGSIEITTTSIIFHWDNTLAVRIVPSTLSR
jgi:hypothetical protein